MGSVRSPRIEEIILRSLGIHLASNFMQVNARVMVTMARLVYAPDSWQSSMTFTNCRRYGPEPFALSGEKATCGGCAVLGLSSVGMCVLHLGYKKPRRSLAWWRWPGLYGAAVAGPARLVGVAWAAGDPMAHV